MPQGEDNLVCIILTVFTTVTDDIVNHISHPRRVTTHLDVSRTLALTKDCDL